jgi:hypothetical protein
MNRGPLGYGIWIASQSAQIAVVYGGSVTVEADANARLIAAAPEMFEALEAYERLDDAHANCDECEGLTQSEGCEKCFPLADDARLKMRAAIAKAEGR